MFFYFASFFLVNFVVLSVIRTYGMSRLFNAVYKIKAVYNIKRS